MEQSLRTSESRSDKLLLLVEQQKNTKEGSAPWYAYQQEINQLIAERYLQMLNS